MSAVDKWNSYLEKLAFVQLGLSLFASIGAANGYNVALAFWTLHSVHARTGGATLGTLLIDIVICSIYGGHWSQAGRQYAFALSMMIINMFAKCFSLFCIFVLFNDLGGAFGMGSGDYMPVPQSGGYFDEHGRDHDRPRRGSGRQDDFSKPGSFQASESRGPVTLV